MSLSQIHSANIETVDAANRWTVDPEADGLVTNTASIAISVLTADCAPVLFADIGAGVVGAAHAGWNGALKGVIPETISAMIKIGAERQRIVAIIGPCISQKAYEVGGEFVEKFIDEDPENSRFFINGEFEKYHFDLPSFCLSQLKDQQVLARDWVRKCTYASESTYFSYRRSTHRSEPDYGRQISVITNSKR